MRLPTLATIALAALALAAPAAARGAERILYVGDSLGVGTLSELRSESVPLDGDARVGRTSTEGLVVMRTELRRAHRIVVFDLGTNDYSVGTLAKDLRRARRLSGERPMIVFTLNKPGAGRYNRAIRVFARTARNVVLIDWHRIVTGRHLLGGDGIHASASGYRRRAALVLDAIERARVRGAD